MLTKIKDWRLPALCFAIPLAFWPSPIHPAVPSRWAALAVGLPLAASLWPQASPIWLILGPLVAVGGLSLIWAPDFFSGGYALVHAAIFIGAILAGMNTSPKQMHRCWMGFAFGMLINVGLEFDQYFLVLAWILQGPAPAGLFYNREILAETLAPVAAFAFAEGEILLGFALLGGIALTQSRVGLLALFIGLLPVFWSKSKTWTLLAGLGLLAGVLYLTLSPDKLSSLATRLGIWSTTLRGVSWTGAGIGQFWPTYPHWEVAHSDFLQIAWELGLPAGIAGAALGMVLLQTAWGSPWWPPLAVLALEALVSFPLQLPTTAFMAGLLAGFIAKRGASPSLD